MAVSVSGTSALGELGTARTSVRATRDQLREATGRVVGSVFYGTMLKMMRESSLKTSIGHGGRGEEAFAGQLDGIMAERLGNATKRGLGEALYQRLARQQALMDSSNKRMGVQG